MRFAQVHYHHGTEMGGSTKHHHDDFADSSSSDASRAITYLEYQCDHNEEHKRELIAFAESLENPVVAQYVVRSAELQGEAAAGLRKAIELLGQGE